MTTSHNQTIFPCTANVNVRPKTSIYEQLVRSHLSQLHPKTARLETPPQIHRQLCADFLLHHGYLNTWKLFTLEKTIPPNDSNRKHLCTLVQNKEFLSAIEFAQSTFPTLIHLPVCVELLAQRMKQLFLVNPQVGLQFAQDFLWPFIIGSAPTVTDETKAECARVAKESMISLFVVEENIHELVSRVNEAVLKLENRLTRSRLDLLMKRTQLNAKELQRKRNGFGLGTVTEGDI